jgi:hypothetical protein
VVASLATRLPRLSRATSAALTPERISAARRCGMPGTMSPRLLGPILASSRWRRVQRCDRLACGRRADRACGSTITAGGSSTFQPSSRRKGSYLNVGEQHLWCERDYFIFERHERPASGAAFIEFTSDETTFEAAMTGLAEGAVTAVVARRQAHGDGHDALRFVAATGDDFNAGVALGLLGDVPAAAARLEGRIHPAFQPQAARYREALFGGDLEAMARAAVDRSRSHLKLPPTERTWRT